MIKYKNILFVCTGNTCRSPMAEVLFKKMLKGNETVISSAGTAAFNGSPATDEARGVMKKRGLDLSGHKARRVNEEIVKESSIVFVMTQRHYDELVNKFPEHKDKIFILKQYAGFSEDTDIFDPIGESREVYENCARIIEECLRKIINKLF